MPVSPGRVRGLLLAVALIAGVLAIGWIAGHYVHRFAVWVDGLGVWGPLVFVLGYALAVVAFVPASLLTLAAGAIFGVASGTAYVLAVSSSRALPASEPCSPRQGDLEIECAGGPGLDVVVRQQAT